MPRIPHEGRTPPLNHNVEKAEAGLSGLLRERDAFLRALEGVMREEVRACVVG